MNVFKKGFILLLSLMLIACGRSTVSQFYVLNPIPFKLNHSKNYSHLRIGISEIDCPAYMCKPQFVMHHSSHRVALEEFHQWAGSLDKNIRRVIETNLSTLLPGAAIVMLPWNPKFKPNYQLQINISQFDVNMDGNSVLRADYFIYSDKQLIKKGTHYYHQKILNVTVEKLVESMNVNLTRLTKDIAHTFSNL